MSLCQSTRDLFDIQDENIHVSEVRQEFQGDFAHRHQVKIIRAELSYALTKCPLCGFSTVRPNGHKLTHIKMKGVSDKPLILELNKQRWLCANCHQTTIATTPVVARQHAIATSMAFYLLQLASLPIPVTHIANITGISESSVQRIIDENCHLRRPPHDLPKQMCFDEFRSTNGMMSFICADAATHHLVTLLPDRLTHTIKDYFLVNFSLKQREKVRLIVMDMNAQYGHFIRELFPHAEIVIDRFHMIQLMTRAIDHERLTAAKTLDKHSRLYKIVKANWQLFHKIHLESAKARHLQGIEESMTEQHAVSLVLNAFPALKDAYHTYVAIYEALIGHHANKLQSLIQGYQTQGNAMDSAIATLKKNLRGVLNAATSAYSNGPIEGIIRKAKALKRSCFGFKNQYHFFIRLYQILI